MSLMFTAGLSEHLSFGYVAEAALFIAGIVFFLPWICSFLLRRTVLLSGVHRRNGWLGRNPAPRDWGGMELPQGDFPKTQVTECSASDKVAKTDTGSKF